MSVKAKETWRTLSCEKVEGDYYLFVGKSANGVRWRYSVTPVEYAQRPRSAFQWARASGYMRSFERAIRAAEIACVALKKSDSRDTRTRGRVEGDGELRDELSGAKGTSRTREQRSLSR